MALLCVCLGLRISEALALRWSDVDWLGSRLSIRRGIVQQHVDECKTEGSAKTFVLAEDLLAHLKAWKQASQFTAAEDWVFASPFQLGRLPYSYTGTRMELVRASEAAKIGGHQHPCLSAHLPVLAGRCEDSDCRTTENDVSHGHSDDDEYLR
jgi:integrase